MPLWKKFWLLFAVISVIVAGLHAATIVAFSEPEKAILPAFLGLAVPAVIYLLLWAWVRWRGEKP